MSHIDDTISDSSRVAPPSEGLSDDLIGIIIGMGAAGFILLTLFIFLWFVNRWLKAHMLGQDSGLEDYEIGDRVSIFRIFTINVYDAVPSSLCFPHINRVGNIITKEIGKSWNRCLLAFGYSF